MSMHLLMTGSYNTLVPCLSFMWIIFLIYWSNQQSKHKHKDHKRPQKYYHIKIPRNSGCHVTAWPMSGEVLTTFWSGWKIPCVRRSFCFSCNGRKFFKSYLTSSVAMTIDTIKIELMYVPTNCSRIGFT